MVNFTSSDPGWTSISTSNFGQNVEFFYYNGSIIPSWLENYTSSHALWWLKLGSIPAGSSETVYVGFAPSTTNLFNTVNDGEAPTAMEMVPDKPTIVPATAISRLLCIAPVNPATAANTIVEFQRFYR